VPAAGVVQAGDGELVEELVGVGPVDAVGAAPAKEEEPVAERVGHEGTGAGHAEAVEELMRRLLLPQPGLDLLAVDLGCGAGNGIRVRIVDRPAQLVPQVGHQRAVDVGHLHGGHGSLHVVELRGRGGGLHPWR
jgi:hypothetical protein